MFTYTIAQMVKIHKRISQISKYKNNNTDFQKNLGCFKKLKLSRLQKLDSFVIINGVHTCLS